MEVVLPSITPTIVLSVMVGLLHACLYLVVRGTLRLHLVLVAPAAIVGALLGQAFGARHGDQLAMGDYGFVSASLGAWVGIALVAILSKVLPSRADV